MGIARIAATFNALKKANKKALVTYNMAYDPDYDTSCKILKLLSVSGADILEVGMPFSDPVADGPTIQKAGNRALAQGATLAGVLEMIRTFRKENQDTPIILMGYYNVIYHYGIEGFCEDAKESGIDGMIIVDLPPEEDAHLLIEAQKQELALIRLITPTTDMKRFDIITQHASGFLYYVSVAGITGTVSATKEEVCAKLVPFQEKTDLPIVVGFGIDSPEKVEALRDVADGVVVGSAIVKRCTVPDLEEEIMQFTRSLSKALH